MGRRRSPFPELPRAVDGRCRWSACRRIEGVFVQRADVQLAAVRVQDVMSRSLVVAATGLLLTLAACGAGAAPTGPMAETIVLPTAAPSQPATPPAEERMPLPPLPDQGLVLGRAASVSFVTLDGDVIDRLPGFRLYYDWTVPGPVILRSHGVYYILDVESHELRPLASRDEAFQLAPQFQEGVDPAHERFELVDEPDKTGAPDASGFWAFALPSPDGSMLLTEWSGECESQTAFLAQADGSHPVPVTGERGLADARSSSVIGWTADGGALVFLGPGGACGSVEAPAGIYRFEQPGVGAMMIAVHEPNGVRMWGSA